MHKKCGSACGCSVFLKILLIIGAINWGLVGLGGFLGQNLNVVNLLLGGMPSIEWIVYIVVGLAGVFSIFGCRCKKCSTCVSVESSTSSAM